jgi:hypothetical protein
MGLPAHRRVRAVVVEVVTASCIELLLCSEGRLPDYIGAEVKPMKNQLAFRHVECAQREGVTGYPTKGCLIFM